MMIRVLAVSRLAGIFGLMLHSDKKYLNKAGIGYRI